jgi:hypothetical protein
MKKRFLLTVLAFIIANRINGKKSVSQAKYDKLKADYDKLLKTYLKKMGDELDVFEDDNDYKGSDSKNGSKGDKICRGDIIKFGKYDWKVLDVEDDKALIITNKTI